MSCKAVPYITVLLGAPLPFGPNVEVFTAINENKSAIIKLSESAFTNELNFFGVERENDFSYMIGVPLKNQENELIGFLCILERNDILDL